MHDPIANAIAGKQRSLADGERRAHHYSRAHRNTVDSAPRFSAVMAEMAIQIKRRNKEIAADMIDWEALVER